MLSGKDIPVISYRWKVAGCKLGKNVRSEANHEILEIHERIRFRVFRGFRGLDDFQEDGGEFLGGYFRMFLEAEEGGDFGGGFSEREGEFAVIHLLVGGH
jgi:hypothetical protein